MTIFRWRETIGVIARRWPEASSFLGKQTKARLEEERKVKVSKGFLNMV